MQASWSSIKHAYADVLESVDEPKAGIVPMLYTPDYNITFWGLEKLHPFDSCKFRKIVASLQRDSTLAWQVRDSHATRLQSDNGLSLWHAQLACIHMLRLASHSAW